MQEVSLATLCADTKIWDTKIWDKPAQSNTARYNNGLTGPALYSRPGAAVTEDYEVAASNDRNVLSHSRRPESEIKVPSGAHISSKGSRGGPFLDSPRPGGFRCPLGLATSSNLHLCPHPPRVSVLRVSLLRTVIMDSGPAWRSHPSKWTISF